MIHETFPSKRSPDDIRANEDTLGWELQAVLDRHNNDMSHAAIVKAAFGMLDSYADAKQITYHFETVKAPGEVADDGRVPIIIVPDADDEPKVPMVALQPEECDRE